MNTPLITEYYRATKPRKRRELLEQSIQAREDPEKNAIRLELVSLRYPEQKNGSAAEPVDALMRVWMYMEFNKNASKSRFHKKAGRKEIRKNLDEIQFTQILNKSELHRELLYEEICHMLKLYMSLCEKDKSYRNTFFGLLTMNDDSFREKLRSDVYETAVLLPRRLEMQEELKIFEEALREVYPQVFPDEDPLPRYRDEEQ